MPTFTDLLKQQLSELPDISPAAIAYAVSIIGICVALAWMDHKGLVQLLEPFTKQGREARRERDQEAENNGL